MKVEQAQEGEKKRKVLILGGDADGNLGDRAILQAICQELRAIHRDIEITVVSSSTNQGRHPFADRIVPRGLAGLPGLCAAALRSDVVICGGGGLFQDDDSLVKMPYWAFRVALMRLLNPRVIGYSLGVGPLRAHTSRLFARLAFACMECISVRDPEALHTAQALTNKTIHIVPDPAFLCPAVAGKSARSWLRQQGVPLENSFLIGVAPRRWFPAKARIIPHSVSAKFRSQRASTAVEAMQLTTLLARVLDGMVQRHGAFVLFLPTYCLPHEGDDRVAEEILKKMSSSRGKVLRISDPALYKGVAGQLRVMLGGRMHPTIFAASAGTPAVALAYNQKFFGLFELLGLREYVLDVKEFVRGGLVEDLSQRLEAVIQNKTSWFDKTTDLADEIRAFSRSVLIR